MINLRFTFPTWPAPSNVRAVTTTRIGGVSRGPYAALNLATHVGDEAACVAENRRQLTEALVLPTEPVWLQQVHSDRMVDAEQQKSLPEADGSFSFSPGVVCAVLTADCLPVFLCDQWGTRVGIMHAGWRGLAAGILEKGVAAMGLPASELLAWLGPAIGPEAFEVGEEVRQAFLTGNSAAVNAFKSHGSNKWLADLYQLARLKLRALGLENIAGGDRCTFRETDEFFSYRRDGVCGRMASLIWLDRSHMEGSR